MKKNVKEIINMAFREITEKGYFDIEKGNAPIPGVYNGPMSDIPQKMTDYVNDCGFGCCFVFSAYMINILNHYNINAYMVASIEGNGIRASVLYEDNGEFYIANPVEDIEYFTDNNVSNKDRCKYYIDDTSTMVIGSNKHDDSRYTIEEFERKYGQTWVLGAMTNDTNMTLASSMSTYADRCIAPPEKANIKVKQLLRTE